MLDFKYLIWNFWYCVLSAVHLVRHASYPPCVLSAVRLVRRASYPPCILSAVHLIRRASYPPSNPYPQEVTVRTWTYLKGLGTFCTTLLKTSLWIFYRYFILDTFLFQWVAPKGIKGPLIFFDYCIWYDAQIIDVMGEGSELTLAVYTILWSHVWGTEHGVGWFLLWIHVWNFPCLFHHKLIASCLDPQCLGVCDRQPIN